MAASHRSTTRAAEHPRVPALRAFGVDAVAFQSLESGLSWWDDTPTPSGTSATVAYADTGRAWIAVGRPLTAPAHCARAAARFVAAARKAGRRAVFFGVESLEPFTGLRHLQIGRQSVLLPDLWPVTLGRSRRLREQLRRARAKGIAVRRVPAAELGEHSDTRRAVERLREEWLASRHMEPMGFLVSVEPFHEPDEHLYLLAERRSGEAVEFLSAVPVPARGGWLLEDVLRSRKAPNGTTELMLDRVMRELNGQAIFITPGVTPLSGPLPWWLRVTRTLTAPLYDFSGLERFRARLAPARWDPVWVVWDRGPAPVMLIDVLRAFARGSLVWFGLRSVARHPTGPAWMVSIPLVPWTMLMAVLASTRHGALLGFSPLALRAWTVFDALLSWWLFQAARRPRRTRLFWLASLAAVDAVLSIRHLAIVGLGPGHTSMTLRILATVGPVVGTVALAWAARQAHDT